MEDTTAGVIRDIERRWEGLTISDDFVFGKAMLDERLCREVLEAILGVGIDRIEYLGQQEQVDLAWESKGVRLDVYVRDDRGSVYNVEMQAANTRELPQRARYYQSLMSLDQLRRGQPYRALKDAYVIFVCDFDLFGRGRRVYSFQNRCDDDGTLALGDGAHVLFLSATAPEEPSAGPRLNEFLDYVASGKVTGELSGRLDEAVAAVLDTRKWRLEYMMLEVRDQLNVDKGREIGMKLGLEQGRAEGMRLGEERGEERLAALLSRLVADGRSEDVGRALTDPAERQHLYEELGIPEDDAAGTPA